MSYFNGYNKFYGVLFNSTIPEMFVNSDTLHFFFFFFSRANNALQPHLLVQIQHSKIETYKNKMQSHVKMYTRGSTISSFIKLSDKIINKTPICLI